MASILNCLVTFLIVLVINTEAARILAFFPFPSISHQVVFRPFTQELARRGHEVTVITTDPAFPKGQTPANFTEIDIHDTSYKIWRDEFVLSAKAQETGGDWPSQASVASRITVSLFEQQLLLEQVRSVIFDKTKKYDLLILEACVVPLVAVSHVHKVPVIQISSFGPFPPNIEAVGAPMHVFLYPTPSQQRVGNKLTTWQKIDQLIVFFKLSKVFGRVYSYSDEMLKRVVGPDTPPITELNKNIDMLFMNVHPLWDLNRPVPPNVIYLGGLHQKPEKELPQELQSYLDSSKNGVIYISFGTNIEPSLLPPERIQTIVNVVSKLPFDILWKWNQDELPGRTANIRISKWLPQSDMLRHPKIKLFITQAGLQSTDEAITAGVPLLGVPMLGDQWYNADLYKHYHIGERLDLELITEESLRDAINTVIGDESYRKNIAKIRAVVTDEPQKPLQRAIWWTEYVLRHSGAKHLVSPGANITWTEYLELELVLYLSITVISVLLSFILLISYLRKQFGSITKVKTS